MTSNHTADLCFTIDLCHGLTNSPPIDLSEKPQPSCPAVVHQQLQYTLEGFRLGARNISQTVNEIYTIASSKQHLHSVLKFLDSNRNEIMACLILPCLRDSSLRTRKDSGAHQMIEECCYLISIYCNIAHKTPHRGIICPAETIELIWYCLRQTPRRYHNYEKDAIKLVLLSTSTAKAAVWLMKREPDRKTPDQSEIYSSSMRMIMEKMVLEIASERLMNIENPQNLALFGKLSKLYFSKWCSDDYDKTSDEILLEQMVPRRKHRKRTGSDDVNSKTALPPRSSSSSVLKSLYSSLSSTLLPETVEQSSSPIYHYWKDTFRYRFLDIFWEFCGYPVDD